MEDLKFPRRGCYCWRILQQPIIHLPEEEKRNLILSRALLGNSKDTLDIIDIDVELNLAISMFGHFLKFEVSDTTEPMHDHEPRRSAFDVMMAAQRQLCLPRLPPRIETNFILSVKIVNVSLRLKRSSH